MLLSFYQEGNLDLKRDLALQIKLCSGSIDNDPSRFNIQFHTGTYDRNQNPIFEGDMLRSVTCEIPFKVENIVDFLMMCGAYKEKNGCDIFDSLEIVSE